MKKYFFLTLVTLLLALTNAIAQTPGTKKAPTGVWNKVEHDFGIVPQGVPVSVTFKVKNGGPAGTLLVISSVNAQCGCTTPSYSKEPIASGSSGEVKAQYNAASAGPFTKTVTVTTNDPSNPSVVLTLKGTVVAATNNNPK